MAPPREAAPRIGPRMTIRDIEDLVIYLLRVQAVADMATDMLQVDHFDFDTESIYALVWAVSSAQRTTYGDVSYVDLQRELSNAIEADGQQTYTADQIDSVMIEDQHDRGTTGLLHLAFHYIQDWELNPDVGIALLQRFLHERTVVQPLQTLITSSSAGVLLDLQQIIDATSTQQLRIRSLNQGGPLLPFAADGEIEPVRDSFPVPIAPFMDSLMPEGQAAGEAYCIMALPSFGKTTILTHLAVATGQYFFAQAAQTQVIPKTVWTFTWEEEGINLRWRLQSCAAKIQKQRLESKTDRLQLTSAAANNLLAYEQALQIPGSPKRGELDRLHAARWMQDVIRISDMRLPGRGENLYRDVHQELDNALRRGEQIGMIVLDHAMKMADRYIMAGHAKQDHMRHVLRQIADGAQVLADRYHCPVWIAHQAKTALAVKSATSQISTGAGAECGSFEQPLTYSFVLGPKNTDGISLLWSTKDRKTGRGMTSACIRLDGALQQIKDCSQDYVVDGNMGRIVNRNEAGTIAPAHVNPGYGGVVRRAHPTLQGRRDGIT